MEHNECRVGITICRETSYVRLGVSTQYAQYARSRVERRIHIFEMALTASLFMNKGTGAALLGSAVFQEPRLLMFEIFESDERPRATCYIKRTSFSAATGPTRRARSIRRAVSSEIGLEGEKLWSRSCEAGDEKEQQTTFIYLQMDDSPPSVGVAATEPA